MSERRVVPEDAPSGWCVIEGDKDHLYIVADSLTEEQARRIAGREKHPHLMAAIDAIFDLLGGLGAILGLSGALYFAVRPEDYASWLVLTGTGAALIGASVGWTDWRRNG